MTSQNRGGDDSSRRTQRGNNGNQEARDMSETGRFEDDIEETGAFGSEQSRRNNGVTDEQRGVGNNTDGVIGGEGNEGLGNREVRKGRD